MKMKILILVAVLLGSSVSLWAQGKLSEEKRKEFEAQKVAYYTQELDLTPEEAAVFWPLYNEMMKKIKEQEVKLRELQCVTHKTKNLTEAQEKQRVMDLLEYEQKMLDLKKMYYQKLLNVVPAQKVARLDRTERKFHRQLLQKMCKEPECRK